jgi:hypothetical protein
MGREPTTLQEAAIPRNSAGVYSSPAGALAVTETPISSTDHNNLVLDQASALTGSLPRDGTAGMLANLAMGGFKVTGLAAGVAAGDAMRFEQFFPSGTLMLFQQDAAPTGWTKQVTHNDKALRVVSGTPGSGGTKAFSTLMATAKAVTGTAITQAQLPVAALSVASIVVASGGAHTHDVDAARETGLQKSGSGTAVADNSTRTTTSDGSHTHGLSGSVPLGGSGSTHNHTIDLDISYVDLIIAAKD